MIVLDEVDQLDSRGQEILYTIFEWPSLRGAQLLLIGEGVMCVPVMLWVTRLFPSISPGVANALDLTDRVLPRLQSHVQCRPQLLHFPPYTKDQIVTILQGRLGNGRVVDPMAVQFIARKVAAVHGDVRKALDICRLASHSTQPHISTPHLLHTHT